MIAWYILTEMDFNPRSPWGERHMVMTLELEPITISIHAPRGGSDVLIPPGSVLLVDISIHAPRGGSDSL